MTAQTSVKCGINRYCLTAIIGCSFLVFQGKAAAQETSTQQQTTLPANPTIPLTPRVANRIVRPPAVTQLPGQPSSFTTVQGVTPAGGTFPISTVPNGFVGPSYVGGTTQLPGQLISDDPFALPGQEPQAAPGTPQVAPIYAPHQRTSQPVINLKRPNITAAAPPTGPYYTFPGVVGVKRGHWVGSDYLYNLPDNIQVIVEIVFPQGKNIPLQEQAVKNRIVHIFERHDILTTPAAFPSNQQFGLTSSTTTNFPPQRGSPAGNQAIQQPSTVQQPPIVDYNNPPLPFFHVIIMPYPFENRYVASCAGRLFEAVHLDRINFKLCGPAMIQAITWEKQALVSGGKEDFEDVVDAAIDEIARAFAERVMFYREIQADLQERRRFYY